MKLKFAVVFVLVCAIFLSAFTLPAYADDTVTGTCGENATFRYANGVLTISGTGEMNNYDDDASYTDEYKWNMSSDKVKKVVVEEGITRIGDYSFYKFLSLEEVILPESVKEIGYGAFSRCENLVEANVAEDVHCCSGAFYRCDKFRPTKITVQPEDTRVENMGDYAVVSVKATGDGLTYQWCYGGSADCATRASTIASGKTDTYRTKITKDRYGRYVQCVITDRYSRRFYSNAVRLTFKNPYPTIVTQPVSVSAKEGEVAKITVKATGLGLTYTWYYKNTNQVIFHKCATTKPYYSIKMTEARDGRQMYCEIRDRYYRLVKTETVTFSLSR